MLLKGAVTNWRQFLCACAVIDHEFRHNIVKIANSSNIVKVACYDEIHCQ